VHSQPIRRDVRSSVVEHLDVQPRLLAEFFHGQARVLDMPAHGESGQSICRTIPAFATVSYSWRIASAIAKR